MMKYPYTGVVVDDEKMAICRFEAHSGPQASAIAAVILANWNHYTVLVGHHILLDENIKVYTVEEFYQDCIRHHNGYGPWLSHEENHVNYPDLAARMLEQRDIIAKYLADMGVAFEGSVPPLVMKALENAAGLNELPG